MLSKEEIPISKHASFYMPIHPVYLDESARIDPKIPSRVFARVADEWYDNLSRYVREENPENREWLESVWLAQRPVIQERYGRQCFDCWEDQFDSLPNGAPGLLSISRNAGGTLYIENPRPSTMFSSPEGFLRLTEENRAVYSQGGDRIPVYSSHNIDYYPGALFLRNWAIACNNAILRDLQ